MIAKRAAAYLLALLTIFAICYPSQNANASMLQEYPNRFTLTGVVELSYRDEFYGLPGTNGGTKGTTYSFFDQIYRLDVSGFIYHPRLAVFKAGISYRDERQLAFDRAKINNHSLGYNIWLNFLPYRPISLEVYASNETNTIAPVGHFVNPLFDSTQSLNYVEYGSRLKITKPTLPFMILEYNHSSRDISALGNKSGALRIDEFALDFRGNLNIWKTTYQGIIRYEDYSSPYASYTAKTFRLVASSTIKKGLDLDNSFTYSEIDFSKVLSFNTRLNIDQGQPFKQFYYYNFLQSQEKFQGLENQGISGLNQKETIHSIAGSWIYRFVNGLVTSLSLNYGRRNESNGTDETAKFYGVSFSASYARSFLDLNFSPSYRLVYRKDELKGHIFENNLELDLVTKKIRWGTVYANYSLNVSNQVEKFNGTGGGESSDQTGLEIKETKVDTISHVLRTGIRGRGPGKTLSKTQWNVEASIVHSDTTIVRPLPEFFFDEDLPVTPKTLRFEKKITRYSLNGNVTYPVGWATIFFSSGASIGVSNGVNFTKYFYEERISYPIVKNCLLFMKLKETWEDFAAAGTRRVDEYDLTAEYRIGQTTISGTGQVLKTSENGEEVNIRLLFLKVRRTIF